jgi:hypothetical protein
VKRERLDFLADNPFYTKRFAHYVGRRCRSTTIKELAKELHLDWDTVKILEKQYMRAQLAKAGTPGPKAIGIDEISIRKGHTYRIVVSDLLRRRPIWFGGEDRSEKSMAMFYQQLGEKKSRGIRLAVMDMWKPFRNMTNEHAPQAAILFDKFHVMRHLGEALDKVRKAEYARLSGRDRSFICPKWYSTLRTLPDWIQSCREGPPSTRSGRTIPSEVWSAKATASSARGFRRTRPPPPHISQWWSMSGGCTHRSPDVKQHSSLSTFSRRLPPVSFQRPCARLRDRPRAFAMYDPT